MQQFMYPRHKKPFNKKADGVRASLMCVMDIEDLLCMCFPFVHFLPFSHHVKFNLLGAELWSQLFLLRLQTPTCKKTPKKPHWGQRLWVKKRTWVQIFPILTIGLDFWCMKSVSVVLHPALVAPPPPPLGWGYRVSIWELWCPGGCILSSGRVVPSVQSGRPR